MTSYAEEFDKRASEADNQDDRVFFMLKAIYHKLNEIESNTDTGSYT